MKVLLLEDDIQLNTTITNFLKSIEYDVVSIIDGEMAVDTIDLMDFNLFIIDINVPNINGLEVVKYIRHKDTTVPIVMITASMELSNLQEAFKNGCNEYIKKPFFLEELEIRVNKLLNKESISTVEISENIIYKMEHEELVINGETIKLRKKERKLLTILLQNINHTVDIEAIHAYVWENEIRESYPLRQLVSELRKYFNTGQKFIFSDIGLGYRFESQK